MGARLMLRLTLHINSQLLQDWEIRNTGGAGDGTCRYEARPITDGMVAPGAAALTVHHRRSDGAEALAAAVLRAVAQARDPRPLIDGEQVIGELA
jgi:hypothetical protein